MLLRTAATRHAARRLAAAAASAPPRSTRFGGSGRGGSGAGGRQSSASNPSAGRPRPASTSAPPPLPTTATPRVPMKTLQTFEEPWSKTDEDAVASVIAESVEKKSSASAAASRDAGASSSSSSSSTHPPLSTPLLAWSMDELTALAVADGQPAYRGKQLYDALTSGAATLDAATSLPKAWRESLAERGAATGRATVHAVASSTDGTAKLLLRLADGHVIEAVGIPELPRREDKAAAAAAARRAGKAGASAPAKPPPRRLTVCVSSQVGCPMRCAFCATGKGGYARNLTTHEIVDQVLAVAGHFADGGAADARIGERLNVVFMGMGEPLLNLRAVLPAVRALNGRLGIGARRITISTVGVPQAIPRLAAGLDALQATLAVSIHAPTQALREAIVPSAKAYPLAALLADCAAYFQSTGRRVTFEYALLAGVNDAPEHAAGLARLLRKGLGPGASHVNVIPWNYVEGTPFGAPTRGAAAAFAAAVEAAGVPASVRASRGQDAAAACGQLRNENQKTPLSEAAAVAG